MLSLRRVAELLSDEGLDPGLRRDDVIFDARHYHHFAQHHAARIGKDEFVRLPSSCAHALTASRNAAPS